MQPRVAFLFFRGLPGFWVLGLKYSIRALIVRIGFLRGPGALGLGFQSIRFRRHRTREGHSRSVRV